MKFLVFFLAINWAMASEKILCNMKIGAKEASFEVDISYPNEPEKQQLLTIKKNQAKVSASFVRGKNHILLNYSFETRRKKTEKLHKLTKTNNLHVSHSLLRTLDCSFPNSFDDQLSSLLKVFVLLDSDVDGFYKKERLSYWSAKRGHIKMLQYLTDLGADFDLTNANGNTPLMAGVKYPEILKHLIAEDLLVNAIDNKGRSALFYAVMKKSVSSVKLLLANGALVNHQDQLGRTALMMAAKIGHIGLVRELVKNGADLELKRNNGMNSLYLARKYQFSDIINFLLVSGADPEFLEISNPFYSDEFDWDLENEEILF